MSSGRQSAAITIIYQSRPGSSHRMTSRQSTCPPIFLPLTFPSLSGGTPAARLKICLCPKQFPENNEETEILIFGTVSLHHLCFNTAPGFFFFCSVQIVGLSYLLRLPGLRDCTGPHSSLPALGTAEGVLHTHTHTHNIHTSRFKGLKDWLV